MLVLAAAAGQLGGGPGGSSWWSWTGGLVGAAYVLTSAVLVARAGATVTAGLLIAGQVLGAVALDTAGGLGVAREELTAGRVLGAALALGGGALLLRAARDEPHGRAGPALAAWGVAVGAALPAQVAANADLRAALDAPFTAIVVNNVLSVSVLVLAATLVGAWRAAPAAGAAAPPAALPWWGWAGGLCGSAFLVLSLLVLAELGAAVQVVLTVLGQQLVALVADRLGLLRLPRRRPAPARLAAVALIAAGAALVQLGC